MGRNHTIPHFSYDSSVLWSSCARFDQCLTESASRYWLYQRRSCFLMGGRKILVSLRSGATKCTCFPEYRDSHRISRFILEGNTLLNPQRLMSLLVATSSWELVEPSGVGHRIYNDNYFTSLDLLVQQEHRQIQSLRTIDFGILAIQQMSFRT